MEKLEEGRKLIGSDIQSAVVALIDSAIWFKEQYGTYAAECAESYYHLGDALLEMARTEREYREYPNNFVLLEEEGEESEEKNADKEESEEDYDQEESEENVQGDAGKEGEVSEVDNNVSEEEDDEGESEEDVLRIAVKEGDESEVDNNVSEEEDDEGESEEDVLRIAVKGGVKVEGEEDKSEGEDENEEGKDFKDRFESVCDDDNGCLLPWLGRIPWLDHAWKMLELSREIYHWQSLKDPEDPVAKQKLANTLYKLAEVALDSDNEYETAIEDLENCLAIRKTLNSKDNRELVKTYFLLGIAFKSIKMYEEAVPFFRSATDVIQIRVENLKRNAEPTLEPRQRLTEIYTLETWHDEIESKIVETIDLKVEQIRKLAENSTSGVGTGTSSNVDVAKSPEKTSNLGRTTNDIQNVVRKKKILDGNSVPLSNADAANAEVILPYEETNPCLMNSMKCLMNSIHESMPNEEFNPMPYEESNPGKSAENIQHLVRKKKM